MNSKQRRLVRRAWERRDHQELAARYGDDVPAPVTRRVLWLIRGQAEPVFSWRPPLWWRAPKRRNPRAYGHRCHCGRKAHVFEDVPLCKLHDDRMPF